MDVPEFQFPLEGELSTLEGDGGVVGSVYMVTNDFDFSTERFAKKHLEGVCITNIFTCVEKEMLTMLEMVSSQVDRE